MYTDKRTPQDVMKLFETEKLVKICAPMVRYSKLQFRSLVRQYGCDLCYTPMILADSFCQSAKARNNEFTTNLNDSPVIVQFAANTVYDFVGASYLVSPYCSGVDLNCGCPQHWAKEIGIGCALLGKPELVADLIRQCRNQINKPFTISVKLRILSDMRKTIEICKQLNKAGISYMAVHARTPSQKSGNINTDALKLIVENVDCPVVSNGGLKNLEDCFKIQNLTNCKGAMVANALLLNPTLFSGSNVTTVECVQKWVDLCFNSTLTTYSLNDDADYSIPERPKNLTFQCFHHHLVFMLEKLLSKEKRRVFNSLQAFKDVLMFLNDNLGIKPGLYNYERFENNRFLNLNCDNRDILYHTLRNNDFAGVHEIINSKVYNPDDNNGKFFLSKTAVDSDNVDCDLSDLFTMI